MGYTHYFKQKRSFDKDEWTQICIDVAAIVGDVQNVQGIALAYECDEPGRQPQIDGKVIRFNGLGYDGHETFLIDRIKRKDNSWFCKTAQKPYDLAVTAVLAYLATLDESAFDVSSDGDPEDWVAGVELAKRVVARRANQIDIPLPILKEARWTWRNAPSFHLLTDRYCIGYCINGKVYVYDWPETKAYCFDSFESATLYFARHMHILNPSGRFDAKRIKSLRSQQSRLLGGLIDRGQRLGNNELPPAFVRPNQLAPVTKPLPTLNDILKGGGGHASL